MSDRSQRGFSKPELVLALIGSVGAPIGGGIWMGTLQNRVTTQELRLDKVEQSANQTSPAPN